MDKDTYIKWLEQTLQEALQEIQDLYNSQGANSSWTEKMEDELEKKKAELKGDGKVDELEWLQQVCKKAVSFYGAESRKQLAQEECAELIQALSKDIRNKKHNVEEEMADVLIMIEQLFSIYDKKEVQRHTIEKLKKLENLMRYMESEHR